PPSPKTRPRPSASSARSRTLDRSATSRCLCSMRSRRFPRARPGLRGWTRSARSPPALCETLRASSRCSPSLLPWVRSGPSSWPRIDLAQGRARVPSFYGLEVVRAAEGTLPPFSELSRRAEQAAPARAGWPAPANPGDAIDEAEHDLALLGRAFRDPQESKGTAVYLLAANAHLCRALRSRARRWLRRWTPADGLVQPADEALQALQAHQPQARAYSPTALQNYSACTYKFVLQAIHRLAPREVPEGIDEIDPLSRGSLIHEAQYELLRELSEVGALPIRDPGAAQQRLEAV